MKICNYCGKESGNPYSKAIYIVCYTCQMDEHKCKKFNKVIHRGQIVCEECGEVLSPVYSFQSPINEDKVINTALPTLYHHSRVGNRRERKGSEWNRIESRDYTTYIEKEQFRISRIMRRIMSQLDVMITNAVVFYKIMNYINHIHGIIPKGKHYRKPKVLVPALLFITLKTLGIKAKLKQIAELSNVSLKKLKRTIITLKTEIIPNDRSNNSNNSINNPIYR